MRTLFLFILLVSFLNTFSQKEKSKGVFYLWDAKWEPTTNNKDAAYFGGFTKISDTCWQLDIYNSLGPMVSSRQYRDEEKKIENGYFRFYHPSGFIDSTGRISDGLLQGEWNFYNDTGGLILQKKYLNDEVVSVTDVLNQKDTLINDSALSVGAKESVFPGGALKWQQYLIKNLKYPERALKANIMGDAIIVFAVNIKGATEDVVLFKSVEYSIDSEALRLIISSPNWTPASKDGVVVRSFKKQKLSFRFK